MIMSISIGWAFQVASALSPGINSEGGLVLVYWREGDDYKALGRGRTHVDVAAGTISLLQASGLKP